MTLERMKKKAEHERELSSIRNASTASSRTLFEVEQRAAAESAALHKQLCELQAFHTYQEQRLTGVEKEKAALQQQKQELSAENRKLKNLNERITAMAAATPVVPIVPAFAFSDYSQPLQSRPTKRGRMAETESEDVHLAQDEMPRSGRGMGEEPRRAGGHSHPRAATSAAVHSQQAAPFEYRFVQRGDHHFKT